jgi:Tc toxin complex TcA C-terminal TcB-binding domain/Neuraminidase-like domain
MQPIRSTARFGERGDHVRELHRGLLALVDKGAIRAFGAADAPPREASLSLAQAFDQEVAEGRFGDATRWLVREFRVVERIAELDGSSLDAEAVDRLNIRLIELGVIDFVHLADAGLFWVHGQLVEAGEGPPRDGPWVRLIDASIASNHRLGERRARRDGQYSILFPASALRPGAELQVEVVDDEGNVIERSERQLGAKPDTRVDLMINGWWAASGRVIDANGVPQRGVQVTVFDVDGSRLQPLGTAQTHSDGGFSVRFPWKDEQAGDEGLTLPAPAWPLRLDEKPVPQGAQTAIKARPDLWATAGKPVFPPPLRELLFNAPRRARLPDIVLPAERVPPVVELDEIYWLVAPRLAEVALEHLDDWRIDFLARDCARPIEWVQALVGAARLRAAAKGLAQRHSRQWPAENADSAFVALGYATCRDSPGLGLSSLLQRPDHHHLHILESGAASARIAQAALQHRGDLLELLAMLRALLPLEPAGEGQPASLGDLIQIAWPDDPAARDELSRRGEGIARWMGNPAVRKARSRQRLADDLALRLDLAAPLHTALRLRELTGGQVALLKLLWPQVKDHHAQEPLGSFAQAGVLDWMNLAHLVAPELAPGTDPSAYGRWMAARAEEMMPAPTLCHRLQTDESFVRWPLYHGLAGRLAAHPDLDLMDDNPSAVTAQLGLSPPEVAALMGLRQIKSADWTWHNTGRAVAAGITSLDDVLRFGKQGVQDRLSKAGEESALDEAAIARLMRVAGHVMSQVAGVVTAFWPGNHGQVITAIGAPTGVAADEDADVSSIRQLLQLDGCACDPCLSMLSPGAYRADLLAFIEASVNDETLTDRRLGNAKDLLLSCDNTKIEKCQLDLAIEQMENAVALPFVVLLPPVQTAAQQLATPGQLGPELRSALRSTTDLDDSQFVGPFSASVEPATGAPVAGRNTWLITDPARHWRVRALDGLLSSSDPTNGVGPSVDVAPLVAALDAGGTLDLTGVGHLLPVMRRAVGWTQLPLSIASAEVLQRNDQAATEVRWTLRVVAEGQLSITTFNFASGGAGAGPIGHQMVPAAASGTGSSVLKMLLSSAPGGSPNPLHLLRHADAAAVSAQINATSSLPPDVTSDLQLHGAALAVQPVAGASAAWRYTAVSTLDIVHRPARLDVVSLTYQSTPELDSNDVEPVHRNPRAYAALDKSVFPWTLPFDESLNHARALLRASGLERRALQEATLTDDQLQASDAWVEEVLGLSPRAAEHITSDLAVDALRRTWGLKPLLSQFMVFDGLTQRARNGSDESLLSRVSVVMHQARLDFGELRLLLAMRYVNPNGDVSISPLGECDPVKMELVVSQGGSILPFCRRLYRFVRLWRALEWPAHALDAALTLALGASNSSSDWRTALRALAQLQLLKQQLNLPVDVLADWFASDFTTVASVRDAGQGRLEGVAPPYEHAFQNPAVSNPPDARLRADRFQPHHPLPLRELGDGIAAALGIRQTALHAWLGAGIPDLAGTPLDPKLNLHRGELGLLAIWRNVLLARALGLELSEYAAAARLSGPSPFKLSPAAGTAATTLALRTAAVLRWCRDASLVQQLGVSFETLEQALAPNGAAANAAVPGSGQLWISPSDAAALLTALQQALRAAPAGGDTPIEPLVFSPNGWPPSRPASEVERWLRWGLQGKTARGRWTAADPLAPATRKITGRALTLLSRLDVLAMQLQRPLGQLRAVLETQYVNHDGALSLPQPAPNQLWRVKGLRPSHLDRLEDFAALQAATGLSPMLLDLALEAVGPGDPLELAKELAALLMLRGLTGLDAARLVAFWSGFSSRVYHTYPDDDPTKAMSSQSLFDTVFAPPGRWTLAADGSLDSPPQHWLEPDAAQDLAKALMIDRAELTALVEHVPSILPPQLAALQEVHQWLSMSRALRLSILQQRAYRAHCARQWPEAAAPFERPTALVAFIDNVERTRPRVGLVIERLAAFAGIDQAVTGHLLTGVLQSAAAQGGQSALEHFVASGFAAASNAFDASTVEGSIEYGLLRTLQTFGWFNSTWKLDRHTVRWLPSASGAGFDLMQLSQLKTGPQSAPDAFAVWKSSSTLFDLIRAEPALAQVLESYRERRIRPHDPQDMAPSSATIAAAYGLDAAFAAELAARVSLSASTSRDPATLAKFIGLVRTCRELGLVDIRTLKALLDQPAAGAASKAAKAARALVLARHDADGSRAVLREAARTVRLDRRDRLVDHLVWRDDLASPNDLLTQLLTDPLQSEARKTTRELHEGSRAQLFLNLCLMGKEPAVDPTRFEPARVHLMRSRVVRNANLNVWLFPWRYWLPEFNDDRSAALVDFENALSQDEATLNKVHQAMRRYVDDLIELANLKVVSMHLCLDHRGRRMLYQLGRTRSQPHAHYWRICQHYQQAGMRWTGWQKIDVPIDGEWPVIFVHQHLMHVCWPLLREAEKTGPHPRWSLQIACVRQLSGRWTQRKLSNDAQFDGVVNLEASRSIYLDCVDRAGLPRLRIYTAADSTKFTPHVQIPEPTQGQAGPFWDNFHPTEWKYVDGIMSDQFGVSVKLSAWLKYQWADTSAGGGMLSHHQLASSGELHVDVQLTVPSANGTSRVFGLSPTYDFAYGRYVARINIPTGVAKGNGVSKVEISVIHRKSPPVSFEFNSPNPVVELGEDNVFDIQATFDLNEEPPGARAAREGAALAPWREVAFDHDGLPHIVDVRPDTLAGIPQYTSGTGTLFVEAAPAAASGRTVAADARDGLPILGPQSDRAARFELCRASIGPDLRDTSIWWLDEAGAAALIDASGGGALSTPRLLPSSPELLNRWRIDSGGDVASLYGDPKQDLVNHSARPSKVLPGWTAGYLPTPLASARDPTKLAQPAFDNRFIQSRDYRELQLDVAWAAASLASQQQRHDVARELLRLLYNPWTQASTQGPKRRWSHFPIGEHARPPTRHELLTALCDPNGDPELKRQAQLQIATALDDPFNPHAIVRLRPAELRTAILAATARNQGALGDALFLQFSNESVDRARIHYVTMAELLGPRPQQIASRAAPAAPKSYRQLADGRTGASPLSGNLGTGHAVATITAGGQTPELDAGRLAAVQQMLSLTTGYFCVPRDDALDELWDFVADRLRKIRNGQNIHGVEQALPLLDPPIDPAVLIRATRAGIGIDDALSELYAPPSHLRFQARLALAQEVIAASLPLASAAWSAQEEADGERLAVMRADHELALLRLTTRIREDELREAEANIDALRQERETLRQEIQFLSRQLGDGMLNEDGDGVPIVDGSLHVKVVDKLSKEISGENVRGMGLSEREAAQLFWLNTANNYAMAGAALRSAAHGSHAIAALVGDAKAPWTAGAHGFEALGDLMAGLGSNSNTWERWQGLMAGFERRHDQVKQEMLSRVSRMKENGKRLAAADIRKAIAKRAHSNLLQDIEHKHDEHEFIHSGRFATEATKRWAKRRGYELAHAGFRLAAEQALMAWQAFRHECGELTLQPPETRAWDNRYLGRFALEALQQSLLRMKVAYESRPPEREITEHVSLRQLDPRALVKLRYTGSCEFELTERTLNRGMPTALFFQRIKTLSVSMPCVVGPYTGVHAKLTLLTNRYRHSDRVLGGNVMAPENFRAAFVPRTSMLTSGAQNDSGMFNVDLRSTQLSSAEGAGLAYLRAEAKLSTTRPRFDYRTISDLVLHIQYTARDGSIELANALESHKPTSPETPTSVLLSCRSDFSQAWHQALQTPAPGTVPIRLDNSLLPYELMHELSHQGSTTKLKSIRWLDIPAALPSLVWKTASEPSKVELPASLSLPCEVKIGSIASSLEDRLLLLEFAG